MDTNKRTLTKAICWQVMGLLTMLLVGFFVTGSIVSGGVMAVVNTAIGFVVYLFYERIWNRISWGRVPMEDR